MATATQKAKAWASTGTVRVTFAKFDSRAPLVRPAYVGSPIAEVRHLTEGDYAPAGMTPLRDATMGMIEILDKEFAKGPADIHIGLLADESGSMGHNRMAVVESVNEFVDGMRDVAPGEAGRVLCVILTDGGENASREVAPDVLAKVTTEREQAGWTFLYLGANQDAWAEAGSSGIPNAAGAYFNYSSTPQGTKSAMRRAGARGQAFVSGQAAYSSLVASDNALGDTIGEDGTLSDSGSASHTPSPAPEPAPEPNRYGSVADALKAAKGE